MSTRKQRIPAGIGIPALVAAVLLVAPVIALFVRVPWSRLGAIVTDGEVLEVLVLSLWTALVSTALCLVLGAPLAWVISHARGGPRRLLRVLVVLPMVAPPVVGGVALLAAFGRRGLLGGPLYDAFGVSIPFTPLAVILAQTFVALPFCILAFEGSLRSLDGDYQEAAATMGAGRWYTFTRVTLPLAAPGLVAGAALSFARAIGEFGATITFAGSLPGLTRTAPLAIYQALDTDPELAYGLSALLLTAAAAVLIGMRDTWWPKR